VFGDIEKHIGSMVSAVDRLTIAMDRNSTLLEAITASGTAPRDIDGPSPPPDVKDGEEGESSTIKFLKKTAARILAASLEEMNTPADTPADSKE